MNGRVGRIPPPAIVLAIAAAFLAAATCRRDAPARAAAPGGKRPKVG
jgi:hypothetical protein